MNTITEVYSKLRNLIEIDYEDFDKISGFVHLSYEVLEYLTAGVQYQVVEEDAFYDSRSIPISSLNAEGQKVRIRLLDRISTELDGYYISNKINNFWSRFSKKLTIPDHIYIHELHAKDTFQQDQFLNYLKYVISVHEILFSIRDHKIQSPSLEIEYFYFTDKPLTIRIIVEKISTNHEGQIDFVKLKLSELNHLKMYSSLLKLQLFSLLVSIEEDRRFQFLLDNFDNFCAGFQSSLELYYNTFDFNKNKRELDVKFLEFIKKIYSGVNEIGNKVLTIPAAYLLLLNETTKSEEKLSYLLIFILSVVYCVVIQLSITNQQLYLKQLKVEKEDLLNEAVTNYTLSNISGKYKSKLNAGFKIQNISLWVLIVILWGIPVAILAIHWGLITL